MRYILPGMGATSAMYAGPWLHLEETRFLDWPNPCWAETISELAHNLIIRHSIEDGDTIIGSSLGGIVACEISKIIQVENLILIGSAKHKEEVSRLLQLISPLVDLAPLQFLQQSAGTISSELTQMFAECDPQFIRNMSKAIMKKNVVCSYSRKKKPGILETPKQQRPAASRNSSDLSKSTDLILDLNLKTPQIQVTAGFSPVYEWFIKIW